MQAKEHGFIYRPILVYINNIDRVTRYNITDIDSEYWRYAY